MQEFRQERHSVSRRVVHLVCVTKYHRKVLDARALEWLKGHCAKVCTTMGAQLLACDGEADYVHLLVEYAPKHSVSVLVKALRSTSSRLLRKERPEIASRYRDGALWSPSYFAASTGGATLETVRRYVEAQRLPQSLTIALARGSRSLPGLKPRASRERSDEATRPGTGSGNAMQPSQPSAL